MSQLNLFPNEKEIKKQICEKYQQTEQSLQEDIKTLKIWMQTQPHLPEILNDKMFENFLFFNKFSLEKTKVCIDMYYTLRDQIPEIYNFTNPKSKNIQTAMNEAYYVILPKSTIDNYRVIYFKLRLKDLVDKLDPKDIVCLSLCLQEIRMNEDVMYRDIIIYDMEGLTLGFMGKLTPSLITKCYIIYHKIFSIPIKNFYLINSAPYVSTLLNIVKNIIKPKIFKRIHICKDTSILFERLPLELIPRDYGGEGQVLEELQESLKVKLLEYQNRFDSLNGMNVNEEKRPEKLQNDEIMGFYGNFKKINLD